MENKRAHLSMLQAVITRMGANSFFLKGWTITLVAALFAITMKESNPNILYVAYFPTVAFWALDSYYLWQEKLFRGVYNKVREIDETKVNFSMDTSPIEGETQSLIRVVFSPTLLVFYGVVLITIVLLFTYSGLGKR